MILANRFRMSALRWMAPLVGLGLLLLPGRVAADQVIPDDLIVQGSACIGLDCVNNESFGFDTIRLKENNCRLQFNDTSTSTGFPTNNWQIRANSSASGGASFLGFVDQGATGTSETGNILFQVTAGAPVNSLFVDSTGRVGFRTGTPVLDLHVNTSNTPGMRLEQNSSGGFTAQTWDIAGNEANFFVRDVTGGSRLPFRIRPGAPTSSIDINASGDVGIGTASPSEKLHVHGGRVFADNSSGPSSSTAFQFFPGDVGGVASYGIGMGATNTQGFLEYSAGTASTASFGHRFVINGVVVLEMKGTGNVGIGTVTPGAKLQVVNAQCDGNNWNNTSSRALKQNIRPLSAEEAWQALRALNAVKFAYKSAPEEECVGFIAEDVPALVARNDRRTLQSMDLVGVLTKVVQDQDTQLADQRQELDQQRQVNTQQQELLVAQQAALKALTKRLEDLEQKSGGGSGAAR